MVIQEVLGKNTVFNIHIHKLLILITKDVTLDLQ
jgi:hypothetical protein